MATPPSKFWDELTEEERKKWTVEFLTTPETIFTKPNRFSFLDDPEAPPAERELKWKP